MALLRLCSAYAAGLPVDEPALLEALKRAKPGLVTADELERCLDVAQRSLELPDKSQLASTVVHLLCASISGHNRSVAVLRQRLGDVMAVFGSGVASLYSTQKALVVLTSELCACTPYASATAELLAVWLPDFYSEAVLSACTANFLQNALHLVSESSLSRLLTVAMAECHRATDTHLTHVLLPLLGAALPSPPQPLLPSLVAALCASVRASSRSTWLLMRSLLASTPSCFSTILAILDSNGAAFDDSVAVVRGAIFFAGMSCWGSQRLPALNTPFLVVLQLMLGVVTAERASEMVVYEVALSVRRLVRKFDHLLLEADAVVDIVVACARFTSSSPRSALAEVLRDTVDAARANPNLVQRPIMMAPFTRLLDEEGLHALLASYCQVIHPSEPDWLDQLRNMMSCLYADATLPSSVRLACLAALRDLLFRFVNIYADQVINSCLLPYCTSIHSN